MEVVAKIQHRIIVQLQQTQHHKHRQQQPPIPGAIQLSAKETSGGYRWINATNGAINPTMNFAVNINKTIQMQNPTDTKHQLLIDVNGKQLTSGDIASGTLDCFHLNQE